jgi:hypothetical protein
VLQAEPARESGPDTFSLESWVDEHGTVAQNLELGSRDGAVRIGVPDGTSAVDGDGQPLCLMELRVVDEPPPVPSAQLIVGSACDLGPDGSTFDPPLSLTLQYDAATVPEGVAENDLTIAYFDEEAGVWIELQGRVDTAASTVTARVPHFTTFAVVGSLRPAAFSIGDLIISPDEAMPGDSITIVAEVTNTGGLEGAQTVTLEIDGVPEEAQDIVLAGGESRAVGFTVSKDTPGSYVARIGASTAGIHPALLAVATKTSTLNPCCACITLRRQLCTLTRPFTCRVGPDCGRLR